MAPMFLAAPLWLNLRLDQRGLAVDKRSVVDAVVLVLSLLRFVLGEVVPFSGHMLFLVYSGATTRHHRYQLLAVALIAETTLFKLWIWRDPMSWSLGLVLGLIASAFLARTAPIVRPRHSAEPAAP